MDKKYVAPPVYGQCRHGRALASCFLCEREKPEYQESFRELKRYLKSKKFETQKDWHGDSHG